MVFQKYTIVIFGKPLSVNLIFLKTGSLLQLTFQVNSCLCGSLVQKY